MFGQRSTYRSCLVKKTEIDFLELGFVDNPELYQYFYVSQGNLDGETVFIFGGCCPFCSMIIPVRDCKGDLIGYLGANGELSTIKDETVIWQPPNFACNL
jgi:hypothetical protein